jgi:hypothetical protein
MAGFDELADRAAGPGTGKKLREIGGAVKSGFNKLTTNDPFEKKQAFANRRVETPSSTPQPSSGRTGVPQQQVQLQKTSPSSPSISGARLNDGGGPGQETVGGQTVRNMMDSEYGPLFQKSKATQFSQYGTDMTPRQPLSYSGAFANGALPNAPGKADPSFSGVPTMYPAQQSVGNDIFKDTAELVQKRDVLQSQMDSFFAKNPLGNDLMANFHAIASQAGRRNEIKEIGDRLSKRDEITGQLAGIMLSGQNQMNVQGLQNAGQLQNTQLGGQIQLQNTGLQNQGQLGVQGLVGQQRLQQIGAEVEGNKQVVGLQGANQMATTAMTEAGADRRNAATNETTLAAAKAKPYDYPKNAVDELKSIHGILYGADSGNLSPEDKTALLKRMDYLQRLSTGQGMTPQ